MSPDSKRLVVVSNRLPISLSKNADGTFDVRPGSGGLVAALSPVLRNRGGLWIGWLGAPDVDDTKSILDKGSTASGYTLVPVELTQEEVSRYYTGFSNEVLWFLFHGLITLCNFDPDYWPAYQSVNRKFAQVITERTEPTDFIWIHDYHLLLCARELRSLGVQQHLGFFLHIPFPAFDTFIRLPWRRELLQGLLQYDLLGFQTLRDVRNFVQCARTFFPGTKTSGAGSVMTLRALDREIRIGAFPIGIDFRLFATRSASDEVHRESLNLQNNLNVPRLILGLDRLDYTKGILYRIRAFADALENHPELRGNVTLLQVVVPSRLDVGRYQHLKDEIERAIGDINGRYTQPGWTPIQYIFRPLTNLELLAYYRIANIALITPLKDGMNLVAKEYCACKLNEDGILILSEFAGAAAQFQHDALLVNPYDVKGTAATIHRALTMDGQERRERMRRLRRITQRSSVFRWVDSFLKVAIAKTIKDFPPVTDFAPMYVLDSEAI